MQARERSGTLNTASWARRYDRDVYATPCSPETSAYGGNQMLLDRDHAHSLWNAHSLGSTWLELVTRREDSAALTVPKLEGMPQRVFLRLEEPVAFHVLLQELGDDALPALEKLEQLKLIREELGIVRRV